MHDFHSVDYYFSAVVVPAIKFFNEIEHRDRKDEEHVEKFIVFFIGA